MAVENAQVSVTTAATKLTSAVVTSSQGKGIPAQTVAVQPVSDIYVGNSGVTTANGFKVAANATVSFDLAQGEELYGICASGTVTTYVIRTGV